MTEGPPFDDAVLLRVRDQLANIAKIDPEEPTRLAIAHMRVVNLTMARISDDDADYVKGLQLLFTALLREGRTARARGFT